MPELLPFIFHFSFLHFSLKLSASSTSMSLGSASGKAAASCWRRRLMMNCSLFVSIWPSVVCSRRYWSMASQSRASSARAYSGEPCELVHAGLQHMQPLGHLVAPRAADLRQHLGGDPVLEGPRLLQLRGEDERVEAALVDDDRLLLATDGVVNHDPIPVFLIHMAVQRIAGVAVAQRCGHVAAHKERLALGVGDGTDRTEVAVIEDLNIVVCSFHNVVEIVRRRSESLAIYSRTSSSPRLIARCLFSGGNKCYLYCFFFNHELHALGIPKGDA